MGDWLAWLTPDVLLAVLVAIFGAGLLNVIVGAVKEWAFGAQGRSDAKRKSNIDKINDYDDLYSKYLRLKEAFFKFRILWLQHGLPEAEMPAMPEEDDDKE